MLTYQKICVITIHIPKKLVLQSPYSFLRPSSYCPSQRFPDRPAAWWHLGVRSIFDSPWEVGEFFWMFMEYVQILYVYIYIDRERDIYIYRYVICLCTWYFVIFICYINHDMWKQYFISVFLDVYGTCVHPYVCVYIYIYINQNISN